jgi:hypothetical protein
VRSWSPREAETHRVGSHCTGRPLTLPRGIRRREVCEIRASLRFPRQAASTRVPKRLHLGMAGGPCPTCPTGARPSRTATRWSRPPTCATRRAPSFSTPTWFVSGPFWRWPTSLRTPSPPRPRVCPHGAAAMTAGTAPMPISGSHTRRSACACCAGGRSNSWPYFNAGFVAFPDRPEAEGQPRFADRWVETALDLDHNCRIGGKRPWLDQISLPLTLARFGYATEVLGETWNYSLARRKDYAQTPEVHVYHYHRFRYLAQAPGGAASSTISGRACPRVITPRRRRSCRRRTSSTPTDASRLTLHRLTGPNMLRLRTSRADLPTGDHGGKGGAG